ncbi:mucin-2 [Teleopsis dalmanni]|uniref:mucin-2 n=1 Tax=Teleopsis dalmanni TaxID=139649 RepID=UPI0018CCA77A|nr:mucin-2 [Teleopsis dalmanni]
MCDGLGRQFSYSCPNTTLFQQRMLICDHWYMVNCSKAESHYAANLLIGQRDKPFVNDEENNLRTPRPDLLDRPYAPDYSGESFRNQYKQKPAAQNLIHDNNAQKNRDKDAQPSQVVPGQTRWKIPPPSRIILPPAYEPQVSEETVAKANTESVRFVPTTKPKLPTATTNTRTTTSPPVKQYISTAAIKSSTAKQPMILATASTPIVNQQHIKNRNNAALRPRNDDIIHLENDDLGTSHSTRYNTSADYNSAEQLPNKISYTYNNRKFYTTAAPAISTTTTALPKTTKAAKSLKSTATTTANTIKVPSKYYEPPFVYPIYNQNDTQTTDKPLAISTATPFTAPSTTYSTTTTTTSAPNRPTTVAGKPFTAPTYTTPAPPISTKVSRPQNTFQQQNYSQNNRFDLPKTSKDTRTPAPAQGFKPPTPRPPVNSSKILKTPTINKKSSEKVTQSTTRAKAPPTDLLPPFQEFIQHDVATTQGPPIYYEWKVPSNGLEPPKVEAPIGVDGREYPDTIIDYNAINAAGGFLPTISSAGDQQKTAATQTNVFTNNPFLAGKIKSEVSTTRTPSSRSVKENSITEPTVKPTTSSRSNKRAESEVVVPTAPADIVQLRKDFSVPEYLFPLENIGRTGYLASDTYNSFQLKIPDRRSDAVEEHQHWFGENPKCPECHPSYVKPGTCEPCLRR